MSLAATQIGERQETPSSGTAGAPSKLRWAGLRVKDGKIELQWRANSY